MKKDIDMELYNDYIKNDETKAFEILYIKYRDKIKYFIYNIIGDYDKAEDITQETFTYILQNKIKNNYSFKFHIYLVAKSRAISYINTEKRRNNIKDKYLVKEDELIYQDITDIIIKRDKQKEILKAIELIDEKYRNAIYLVKIEGLSCKETAEILGESIQNIKNYIHRGKKQLKKQLTKEGGINEMNKSLKTFMIVLFIGILLSGAVYATIRIIENIKEKAEITPTFTSKISTIDTNKVWVGTFNLVWNDFMNEVIKGQIEFVDGYSELANELNKQSFTAEELSEESYYKIYGKSSLKLKQQIKKRN